LKDSYDLVLVDTDERDGKQKDRNEVLDREVLGVCEFGTEECEDEHEGNNDEFPDFNRAP
jgi:hypothetical protein